MRRHVALALILVFGMGMAASAETLIYIGAWGSGDSSIFEMLSTEHGGIYEAITVGGTLDLEKTVSIDADGNFDELKLLDASGDITFQESVYALDNEEPSWFDMSAGLFFGGTGSVSLVKTASVVDDADLTDYDPAIPSPKGVVFLNLEVTLTSSSWDGSADVMHSATSYDYWYIDQDFVFQFGSPTSSFAYSQTSTAWLWDSVSSNVGVLTDEPFTIAAAIHDAAW